MVDDLIYADATHDPEARGIRDGRLATGRFPFDLPVFCRLVLEAFAAVENRPVPDGYGERLRGKTIGIVVDEATNDMQTFYPQYRIQEERGTALLLGRQERATVRLGNPTWEWADNGGHTVTVDRALEAVAPILGEWIEVGLEVFNPVQPNVPGHELEDLKSQFGDRLSFWGAIDQQNLLPFGIPEQIEADVAEKIQILGAGGGYMCSPAHIIQSDTSMENVEAFIRAVKKHGAYD